jgi:hypothetical protein
VKISPSYGGSTLVECRVDGMTTSARKPILDFRISRFDLGCKAADIVATARQNLLVAPIGVS